MSRTRGHGVLGAVFTVMLVAAACGSDRSAQPVSSESAANPVPAGTHGDAEVPTADVDDTAVSAPEVSTTAATDGVAVPDGVVIGSSLDLPFGWQTRTVGHRDAFVELSALDGELAVSRSADGASWSGGTTGVPIDSVRLAASTDDELFVSSGSGTVGAQPLEVAVSTDVGATWTTETLPFDGVATPWLIEELQLDALAAVGDVALAVGAAVARTDWKRYSIEVLGTDHGAVTEEGGVPSAWSVTFEDGFELHVDLVAMGMESAGGVGPRSTAWRRVDGGWTSTSLPFESMGGLTPVQLASGSRGFLAAAVVNDLGMLQTELFSSSDGVTWETRHLPDGFDAPEMPGGVFLAGGPLGYVLAGDTALAFSPDGITWDTVATVDDLDPDVSGFLSASPPAAGEAGFAIVHADPTGVLAPRVLVSPDGRSWETVPLDGSTVDAQVAVNDDSILVRAVLDMSSPGGTGAPTVDAAPVESGGGAGAPRPAAMCTEPEEVEIVAYDLATGAHRWHLCGDGRWWSLRAATDDVLYANDIDASGTDVMAIDAATGDLLGLQDQAELLAALTDGAARPMHAPPVVDDVRLTGGQDDPLRATDANTGELLWSVDDALVYDDVWAVDDEAVYMGHADVASDGALLWSLRAYELRTGDVCWDVPISTPSFPWWVGGGRVVSMWTELTVLSAESGEVLWATDYGTDTFPGMRGALANDHTLFVTFTSAWGDGD